MIRPVLQLGDPRLRELSLPISESDVELMRKVWLDLEETLREIMGRHHFRNSAGISAVQIGVMRRACLVWLPESGFLHILNPIVLEESPETGWEYEGCLSFFDKRGLVSRPQNIRLSYQTPDLVQTSCVLQGWGARILLHEIDHMNGVFYSDRMSPEHQLVSYQEYLSILSGKS